MWHYGNTTEVAKKLSVTPAGFGLGPKSKQMDENVIAKKFAHKSGCLREKQIVWAEFLPI